MASFVQDLRYSVRGLATRKVFAVVAVASLAIGIGVNTAIFSALDALLLRPFDLRDLDRTVIVYDSSAGNADAGTTFAAVQRLRERRDLFSAVMATAGTRPLSLTDGERREQVFAELVTADFFTVASLTLQLGLTPGPDIDRIVDPPPVVVLSHAFWRRRFGSDPGVIGTTLVLNGRSFVAMGVAGEGFTGLDAEASADMWMPMTAWAHLVGEPARLSSDEHWVRTFAVLQPGVTIQQAQGAVPVVLSQPDEAGNYRTNVRPARERRVGSAVDTLAIGGAAFAGGLLVLALACTNVMSLLLARAAGRQREMSVRMALGSSRSRLIRLWLSECLVICIVAGGLGLLIAAWLLDLVVAFKPPVMIGQSESATLPLAFQLDLRVFLFALGLSLLVAGVVGLIAGLQGSRAAATRAIRSSSVTDLRFSPGLNVRSAIIALQISLSLLLLIPCGLFVRSAMNASSIDTGFDAGQVLLLPISTDQAGVRIQKTEGFEQQLIDRISGLPGVARATVMDPVPLWFGGRFAHFSAANEPATTRHRLGFASIGPGYFDTMRIPLLAGRDFTRNDDASAPAAAIVNETLARQFWPGANALGQRIRMRDTTVEVVGIARDAKYLSLAETPEPWLYLPVAQSPTDNPALSLAVRATGDPMQLRAAVEREVRALMPTWPAFQFRTLDEGVELQRSLPRFGAMVLGALGAFGALLAAAGIFGVMAHVVQQRTREIGIRLALGAPGASVVRLVIRQGMAVCWTGGALGLLIALGTTQFLRSVLFGVSAVDPIAYVAMSGLLAGVAFLACYLPARRAATVNPVDTLRRD